MTRKHFEAIAASLARHRPTMTLGSPLETYHERLEAWERLANDMADTLARFNLNFDQALFLGACDYSTS